jgi:hypothetical protein
MEKDGTIPLTVLAFGIHAPLAAPTKLYLVRFRMPDLWNEQDPIDLLLKFGALAFGERRETIRKKGKCGKTNKTMRMLVQECISVAIDKCAVATFSFLYLAFSIPVATLFSNPTHVSI